jgi:hypothetical protein
MNRFLRLPARALLVLIARVVGPEMVYPNAAGESIMAAIHHYGTEVNDEQRKAS